MRNKLKVLVACVILMLSAYGIYSFFQTDYKKEYENLLDRYRPRLEEIANFVLKNQIDEIEFDKNKCDFDVKSKKPLNENQKKFIDQNFYFESMYYLSWDTWGVCGGIIKITKVQRQDKSILFFCNDVESKKDNLRLVYIKKNYFKNTKTKYRLKNIINDWYYYIQN